MLGLYCRIDLHGVYERYQMSKGYSYTVNFDAVNSSRLRCTFLIRRVITEGDE